MSRILEVVSGSYSGSQKLAIIHDTEEQKIILLYLITKNYPQT